MTESDKAYLAGILDGEGYITLFGRSVKYGKSYRPQFVIASTSIEWLKHLRATWNSAGNMYESGDRKNPKWKPFAQWTVIGKEAQQILSSVLPYLRLKNRQAQLVIEFEMVGQGKRRSKEQLEAQIITHLELSTLNQRGLVSDGASVIH